MEQDGTTVAVPGAVPGSMVHPLDDLPARLHRRRQWYWLTTALIVVVVPLSIWGLWWATGLYADSDTVAWATILFFQPGSILIVGTGAGLWLTFRNLYRAQVRDAQFWRTRNISTFGWYEAWADDASGAVDPWWDLRHRLFLQLFVHPDRSVPRYLTRGTDLVVAGGCSAEDLQVVGTHLDLLLHRALALGVDHPAVRAALRPVPADELLRGWRRRHWEVHDPGAAHALLAPDLASGRPPAALIDRYRQIMRAAGSPP